MGAVGLDSPLGRLTVRTSSVGVTAVDFDRPAPEDPDPLARAAADQLRAWFAGQRRDFDLPLDLAGTDWQRAVWGQLLTIPFGQTRSYGDLARALGQPGAAQAVGLANGSNPVAIIVPCHRVIGASGELVGYAGGLHRKRWLLEHEGSIRQRPLFG